MSEKCPLSERIIYWMNSGVSSDQHIPEICQQHCGEIWEKLPQHEPDHTDYFEDICQSGVDHSDESLQVISTTTRSYGILYLCGYDGEEAFSESWNFECPAS